MKKINTSFLLPGKFGESIKNFKDFRIQTDKTLEEISEVSEIDNYTSVTQTYNDNSSYPSSSRSNMRTKKVSSFLRNFLTQLQKHKKIYFFFYKNASVTEH